MPEPTALSPFAHPPCAELRSKRWYFLEAAPRSAAELLDASNAVWCARTGGVIGPDSEVVDAEDCCADRRCFAAGFARPQA